MNKTHRTILITTEINKLLNLDDSFSEREGFIIRVAADCDDLQEIARRDRPDIIFTASSFSSNDAICCHTLKQDAAFSDIPIIAVVDSNKLAELNHVQRERPDDVLFTPVSTHLFLAAARKALGLKHRAFPRQRTSLLVHYGNDPAAMSKACAFNLSTGGIFIVTEQLPAVDDKMHIQLDIPTAEQPIVCQGVVTWLNQAKNPVRPDSPTGFGLQFTTLKVTDLFNLRAFIAQIDQQFKTATPSK